MIKIGRLEMIVLFFLFPITTYYAQYTDIINSNRPGLSMSSFGVGKNVFQVETGVYAGREKHEVTRYTASGLGLDIVFRVGLLKEELEFILEGQYQKDQQDFLFHTVDRQGFRKSLIGAKYLLYDPYKDQQETINIHSWKANQKFKWRKLIPAIAVYAGANIRIGTNPYTFPTDPSLSPKIMLITQNVFDLGWTLMTNVIADKIMTDYPSYGYIVTITKAFSERWSGFLENQGYTSHFNSDFILKTGAAYLIKEDIQLDVSMSSNIKSNPSLLYGGIGFAWRFDKYHRDVVLHKEDQKDSPESNTQDEEEEEEFEEDLLESDETIEDFLEEEEFDDTEEPTLDHEDIDPIEPSTTPDDTNN